MECSYSERRERNQYLKGMIQMAERRMGEAAAAAGRCAQVVSPLAKGVVAGFGVESYLLALRAAHTLTLSTAPDQSVPKPTAPPTALPAAPPTAPPTSTKR